MHSYLQSFLVVALPLVAALLVRKLLRKSVVQRLRGPASPSWLLGHEKAFVEQDQLGDLEFAWLREYGTAYHTKGCLGEHRIFLSDAKGLQHILHTSGYRWAKTGEADHGSYELLGNGVATVGGVTHQRQRKVLNPAFSAGQLRTFSSLFQRLSSQFSNRMRGLLNERGEIINMHIWLGRVTLDAIGESMSIDIFLNDLPTSSEGAFGFKFGALHDETNELAYQLNHLFADTAHRPDFNIVYGGLWRKLPTWFMNLIHSFISSKEGKRFQHFQDTSKRYAREALAASENITTSDPDSITGKDILSILVRANGEEDEKRKLSEDEVLSQMATMILAGHETSASTLTWVLYELSRHPEDQARCRQEIAALRDRVGDGPFSPQDYDNLPMLNAILKESLRLHPIVHTLNRVATCDDVIPLSEAVVTKDGVQLTQIPVEKGQIVSMSFASYNRNPSIWGKDADEWNPDRFMDAQPKPGDNRVPVGVYANLLTFSGGVRGCIGWRFALIEMQIILTEMLENFKFTFPKDVDIKRAPSGLMLPFVRGKMREGIQMPLHVTAL
ncbi:cytochrome P450 [Hymenopellis radicata]|nr:cytochrome P450 [Hymenopellis radicata]